MKRSYWDCRYTPLKDSYDSRRDIRAVNTLYTSQQDSTSISDFHLDNNIYLIRKKLNLNIKDFAKLCNLTPDTISKYEISDKIIQVRVSKNIAAATGEKIEYVGGYNKFPENSFAEKLNKSIFYHAHTHKSCAKYIGVDPQTISRYLQGESPKYIKIKKSLQLYMDILNK